MPHVCACIIARLSSTRLPRKVLVDIEGKPLIRWIVDRLRAVDEIDTVVLCTSDDPDDRELIEYAKKWGTPSIAGDPVNIVSRLQGAANKFDASILLRVTGDNPLISIECASKIIRGHYASQADYTRMNSLPLGAGVEAISPKILSAIQESLPEPSHSEYLVLYAFRPDQFTCLALDAPAPIARPYYSITVDTPDDLALVRTIFQSAVDQTTGPDIREVVRFLDESSDYSEISGRTKIKMPDGSRITYDEFLQLMERRSKLSLSD